MYVRHLLTVACLLFCSANLQAAITLTPVQSVVLNGTSTAATVTIDMIVNNTTAGQQIGFYAFSVNLAGPSVTGISASFDNTSVWNGINHAAFPTIAGSKVTFSAGGPPGVPPFPDPFNIAVPLGNSRVGTITFTTTVNGNYSATSAQESTAGVDPFGTIAGLFGFVQDANAGGGATQITAAGDFKASNFTVSGITAVPEPSSMLLIGVAAIGFAGLRLRRVFRSV